MIFCRKTQRTNAKSGRPKVQIGKLLCEKNLRDVWCRNESIRAEIGQILHTHTQTDTRVNLSSIDILYDTGDRLKLGYLPPAMLYGR